MKIETLSTRWTKVKTTNDATATFTAKACTLTEPTGPATGVWDMGWDGSVGPGGITAQNFAKLIPFGAGTATNTFSMYVWSWELCGNEWVPHLLAAFTCTLSTMTGIAGSTGPINTDKFCDTIAIITNLGNPNVTCSIISPQNNTPGHVVIDMEGAQKIEVQFSTGSSATNCNAMLKVF